MPNLVLFFEKMELYVSSGLSIDMAAEISARDAVGRRYQKSLGLISIDIRSGISLSRSLSARLGTERTISAIIGQGEASGNLPKALGQAKELLERKSDLVKKCVSAMIYPFVIGVMASALTIFLVRFVMPQIIPMLKSLGVALPTTTRVVIFISDFTLNHGIETIIAIALFITGFFVARSKYPSFNAFVQYSSAKIPIIGRLMTLFHTSIVIRSLGSMVDSDLPITKAYESSIASLSFAPIRRELSARLERITSGQSLGLAIGDIGILPHYLPAIVSAGELSGTLGRSLCRAADIMDKDIEHSIKRLTALVEPFMMAGIGCIIGGIALSIMMPIYDISKVLQH